MKKSVRLIAVILIGILTLGDVCCSVPMRGAAATGEETSNQGNKKTNLILNPMGGRLALKEKPFTIGKVLGTLPTPQKEGYVFEGWYTAETNGQKVTENTVGDQTITTVYARWTPLTVTVYLQAGGASLEKDRITVTYGKNYEELPEPKKDKFEFDGWYTDYNEGSRITNGSRVDITSSITLYARWKGEKVSVDFNPAGAESKPKTIQAEFGREYGELPELKREGYVFSGWYHGEVATGKITADTVCNQTEDHTLVAAWIPVEQTVSFDANGGKNVSTKKTIYPGTCYGDLPVAKWAGHTFLGWFTSAKDDADRITSESIVEAPIPKTLYAHWKVNAYEVHLVCNEVGISENTFIIQYGDTYEKLPTPVLDNYTFAGWFTQPVGGTRIDKKEKAKLNSDLTLYAQWAGNEFSVNLDPNGGELAQKNKKVYYGSTYGELPIPTRSGYEFTGWFTSQSGGNKISEVQTVALKDNQTLYAGWEAQKVKLILDANGGTITADEAVYDVYEVMTQEKGAVGSLPVPVREGYTFKGWYTATEGGTAVTDGTPITAGGALKVYAQWSGKPCKVTLEYDGGTGGVTSLEVVCGETYGTLPTPTKENYTFDGWYSAKKGGDRIVSDTQVTAVTEHTLYAGYRGAKRTLTYDANGGTVSSAEKDIYYQETYGALPVPARNGYGFDGWYTQKEGGDRVQEGTIVESKGDITIYAHWKEKGYTVRFDAKGGTVDTETLEVRYGETPETLPTATRNGFKFLGWYASKESVKPISEGDISRITEDKTYIAKWEGEQYTLTFHASGGEVSVKTKPIILGKPYATLPVPRRTGYKFVGWYTKESHGSQVTESTTVIVPENHTLYAMWEPEVFVITFHPNKGTVEVPNVAVPVGTEYNQFPQAVRDGYTFIGWYTGISTGKRVTTLSEGDTLYARWKANQYTVSLNAGEGAQEKSTMQVTYGEKYGTLPTPTKEGATFDGWYMEEDGGTRVTKATKVVTPKNHTLYARWKGVTVELSFDTAGGNKLSGTKEVIYGEPYGVLPEPTREGFEFLGWYTEQEEGSCITQDSIVNFAEAHTVYARWEEKYAEIIFIGNGGKVISDGKKEAKLSKGYVYKMPYGKLPQAVRNGYSFTGWFTSAASGIQILPEQQCNVKLADKYYAHWKANQYEVSFDANGGTCDTEKLTVVFGEPYGKLPVPVYDGYSFAGWYTQKNEGEEVTSETRVVFLGTQTLYARWEVKGYELLLDGNGGKVSGVDNTGDEMLSAHYTQPVYSGGTLGGSNGSFPLFQQSGYDFLGFYAGKDDATPVTANQLVEGEEKQTAYAHWKPKSITVSFDANGGDPVENVIEVLYDSVYGELPVAKRQGYTFEGWTAIRNSARKVTGKTKVNRKTAHTLYAKWKVNDCRITLDANGGMAKPSAITVPFDEVLGELPVPTREQYHFLGWYTDAQGGSPVTKDTKAAALSKDTIYAHWGEAVADVSFNPNGGKCDIESKQVNLDECYGRLPVPKREGYDFAGWSTQTDGGETVDATTVMSRKENHTLYALWREKTPTVLFCPEGGELEQKAKTVTYGQKYEGLPVPELQNYKFLGWFTDEGRKQKVEAKSLVDITETQTLYALWEPVKLTVTLDAQGGKVKPTNVTVLYETAYGELPRPEKDGSVFDGWYTAAEAGEKVEAGELVCSAEPHTLYAHWKKAESNLILDANGGSARIQKKAVLSGEVLGTLPNATRKGYEFTGWYTQAEGGTVVTQNSAMPDQEELTIYAQWKPMQYKVTLDAVGGTVEAKEKEVTFDKVYGEFPVPKYEGYQFAGWYLDIEGKEKVTAETLVVTAKNHTLYAYYINANNGAGIDD